MRFQGSSSLPPSPPHLGLGVGTIALRVASPCDRLCAKRLPCQFFADQVCRGWHGLKAGHMSTGEPTCCQVFSYLFLLLACFKDCQVQDLDIADLLFSDPGFRSVRQMLCASWWGCILFVGQISTCVDSVLGLTEPCKAVRVWNPRPQNPKSSTMKTHLALFDCVPVANKILTLHACTKDLEHNQFTGSLPCFTSKNLDVLKVTGFATVLFIDAGPESGSKCMKKKNEVRREKGKQEEKDSKEGKKTEMSRTATQQEE